MPRSKDFLYFLLDEQNRPLTGNVKTGEVIPGSPTTLLGPDNTPAWLKYSPDGWLDVLVKYARNPKYWGLFRDFTVPMKFVNDGALILRHLFYNNSVEAFAKLLILKSDRSIFPEKHKDWYIGEMDFSKYKRNDNRTVTCNVMEGALSKYLKAFENTVFEIPVDADTKAIHILMDGMEFDNNVKYFISNGSLVDDNGQHTIELYAFEKEEKSSINATDTYRRHFTDNADLFANNTPYLKTGASTTSVKIKYQMNFTMLPPVGYPPIPAVGGRVLARAFDDSGNMTDEYIIQSYDDYGHHTLNIDTTISVPGQRTLFLVNCVTVGGTVFQGIGSDEVTIWKYDNNELDILELNYNYRHPATRIKALTLFRLFEKLGEKMTEGKYKVKSDFLNSLTDVGVTCGDAIRGLGGSVIKTSFSDFFKTLFSRYSIGLAIENDKLVIEQLSYFFDTDIILDLGEVDKCEDVPAEDLFFNTIKAGYENQDYSDVNGRYEFNVSQQLTTPIKRIVKELDLMSPYRADSLGIELYRINYEQKKTSDSKSDNDIFLLSIKSQQTDITTTVSFISPDKMRVPRHVNAPVGSMFQVSGSTNNNFTLEVTDVNNYTFYQILTVIGATLINEPTVSVTLTFLAYQFFELNRPAYSSVSGLIYPDSAFNIELSSKRGLLNNGPYIRSIDDKLDNQYIKFQSGDKNSDLSTTLNGVTITEKENVLIGTLGDRLFLPYYFTFQTSVPFNLQTLLKDNPYGRIAFTWKGERYYGYLWDGGIKPATNDKQSWKLLAAPNNDLTKLIKAG